MHISYEVGIWGMKDTHIIISEHFFQKKKIHIPYLQTVPIKRKTQMKENKCKLFQDIKRMKLHILCCFLVILNFATPFLKRLKVSR